VVSRSRDGALRRAGAAVLATGGMALSALSCGWGDERAEPPAVGLRGETAPLPGAPDPEALPEPAAAPFLPSQVAQRFTGDLPAMHERKLVRALVSLSRTDFFLTAGRPRGIQAEALHEFEKFLNRGASGKATPVRIAYVPVPFEDLLPALREGRGDLAAAFLTITPERERDVSIASGRGRVVNEVVVTHEGVTDLERLEDLSGRSVLVLRGSSYAEHLRALNEKLRAAGRSPVDVREAKRELVTEDLLELVNAGVFEITVADDFRARLWGRVLPQIAIREDLALHAGGHVGWAVRKENPELFAAVSAFMKKVKKGSLVGNVLFQRYYEDTRWIDNPLDDAEREKLEEYDGLFKKYGERYGFDWRAIAAQAYQESGLDHTKTSHRGAVGLMQVLPSTARDARVAIDDVSDLESNVHAGVKYLAFLRDAYFTGPELSEEDRVAFAWAAYNAGPANVRRMRARARTMGLDPNRWFHHTEHAALATVGREPVRYVANVYKYYVAYQLAGDLLDGKRDWLMAR
jgi:membrane-bound lytic murein transglycosylase MltF